MSVCLSMCMQHLRRLEEWWILWNWMLVLQMFMNHHVYTGNKAWVLWKSSHRTVRVSVWFSRKNLKEGSFLSLREHCLISPHGLTLTTSSSKSTSQSLIAKHVLLAYKEPQQVNYEPQHSVVTARKVWPTQDNRRDILTSEFTRRLLEVLVSIHRSISPSTTQLPSLAFQQGWSSGTL